MKPYLIKKPVITERSIALAQSENKYTFVVDKSANKGQIRAAVEELFNVKVEAVNTIKTYSKNKRRGKKRLVTATASGKKAVVELKKGDKIDLFDFEEK